MVKLLILVVLLAAIVAVGYLAVRQAGRRPPAVLDLRERQELEASRDLIRALLADAVDVSDVDPVLAPKVIDRIRTHQRELGR